MEFDFGRLIEEFLGSLRAVVSRRTGNDQPVFSRTKAGDLTRFLNGFFDTTTGPKNDSRSYTEIAGSFGLAPSEIFFISDVTRELDAARAAGMKTLLCIRPGNHPQPPHDHETVTRFEGLL